MCENRCRRCWFNQPASSLLFSLSLLLVVVLLFLVVGVRSQDQEVLDDWGLRQVLFRGELGPLALPDEHGCVMSLEASDSLRFARLADRIDRVADSDLRLDRLQLLVECDEHARVD